MLLNAYTKTEGSEFLAVSLTTPINDIFNLINNCEIQKSKIKVKPESEAQNQSSSTDAPSITTANSSGFGGSDGYGDVLSPLSSPRDSIVIKDSSAHIQKDRSTKSLKEARQGNQEDATEAILEENRNNLQRAFNKLFRHLFDCRTRMPVTLRRMCRTITMEIDQVLDMTPDQFDAYVNSFITKHKPDSIQNLFHTPQSESLVVPANSNEPRNSGIANTSHFTSDSQALGKDAAQSETETNIDGTKKIFRMLTFRKKKKPEPTVLSNSVSAGLSVSTRTSNTTKKGNNDNSPAVLSYSPGALSPMDKSLNGSHGSLKNSSSDQTPKSTTNSIPESLESESRNSTDRRRVSKVFRILSKVGINSHNGNQGKTGDVVPGRQHQEGSPTQYSPLRPVISDAFSRHVSTPSIFEDENEHRVDALAPSTIPRKASKLRSPVDVSLNGSLGSLTSNTHGSTETKSATPTSGEKHTYRHRYTQPHPDITLDRPPNLVSKHETTKQTSAARLSISEKIIGSFLFLRFFVPAITSPETHDLLLINKLTPNHRRGLVLCGKLMTALCNDIEFGTKESYLVSFNTYLRDFRGMMKEYIAFATDEDEESDDDGRGGSSIDESNTSISGKAIQKLTASLPMLDIEHVTEPPKLKLQLGKSIKRRPSEAPSRKVSLQTAPDVKEGRTFSNEFLVPPKANTGGGDCEVLAPLFVCIAKSIDKIEKTIEERLAPVDPNSEQYRLLSGQFSDFKGILEHGPYSVDADTVDREGSIRKEKWWNGFISHFKPNHE